MATSHTESLHTDPSAQNLQLPGGSIKSSTVKKGASAKTKASTTSKHRSTGGLNTTNAADASKK